MGRILIATLCMLAFESTAIARQSEALQITQAGGVKDLRDVSQSDLERAARKAGIDKDLALSAIAVSTGVFSTSSGFSTGGQATFLGLMSVLQSGSRPLDDLYLFAWMPRSEAPSAEAAANLIKEKIITAVSTSVKDATVSVTPQDRVGKDGKPSEFQAKQHPFVLRFSYAVPQGELPCDLQIGWLFREDPPEQENAPKMLGGYPAYVWKNSNWDAFKETSRLTGYPHRSCGVPAPTRLQLLSDVSSQLPGWMYLYVPVKKDLTTVPFVLNQGKQLFFIEPKSTK